MLPFCAVKMAGEKVKSTIENHLAILKQQGPVELIIVFMDLKFCHDTEGLNVLTVIRMKNQINPLLYCSTIYCGFSGRIMKEGCRLFCEE
jgi:hypothetical protein